MARGGLFGRPWTSDLTRVVEEVKEAWPCIAGNHFANVSFYFKAIT
jgi:hypothetical protein